MSPARMSKFESGLRTVMQFNEALNRHDVPGMMALMSDDCVFEGTDPAPDGTVYKGRQAVTRYWEELFRQTPAAHIDIEELFGVSLRVVMRWRYQWGPGEQEHVRGVDIYTFRDGLIYEKLSYVKG